MHSNGKGDFHKTIEYLVKAKESVRSFNLRKYGEEGVRILSSSTPIDSGKTANSWYYVINGKGDNIELLFCNSNIQNGVLIAIILQYGHGTGTGGWVQGRDYINPALAPIFDKLAKEAWEGCL